MPRILTSALLAITLTLGCGGVALAQAPKPKPAQAKVDDQWAAIEAAEARKDYSTEAKLLRTFPYKNSAGAQSILGAMYESGRGVSQDYTEAARLYRLASSQGYDVAQVNLGLMYRDGLGVPQNYIRAYMWLNLGGIRAGKTAVNVERDKIAAKMTPAQIVEAQEMARKCQASNFKQCQ